MNKYYFKHLEKYNQTYLEHLADAFHYSYLSLKSCILFFIHGIYPDIFTYTGSENIGYLNNLLKHKKNK